jgi:hypothetical protein
MSFNVQSLEWSKNNNDKKFMAQPKANVSYQALIDNDIFRSNLPSYFRHTFHSIPNTFMDWQRRQFQMGGEDVTDGK